MAEDDSNKEDSFPRIETVQVRLAQVDGGEASATERVPVATALGLEGGDTLLKRYGKDGQPVDRLPPGLRGRVDVIAGPDKGATFLLTQPQVCIGRGARNDVVLTDPSVSSKHAQIYFCRAREWRLRDLNSTNGTLLNGSRVQEFAIRMGDKIMMGETLLRFGVEQT
jgi:hypothetical protein